MSQTNDRRRTLLVDRVQQQRMVFGLVALPCAILLAAAAGYAWIYWQIAPGVDATAQDATATSPPTVLTALLAATCFLFAAIAALLCLGLRTSHRIYGPAYRIGKCLAAFTAGDMRARVRLRDGDHLEDLAGRVNRFLEFLEAHATAPATPISAAAPAGPALDDIPPALAPARESAVSSSTE